MLNFADSDPADSSGLPESLSLPSEPGGAVMTRSGPVAACLAEQGSTTGIGKAWLHLPTGSAGLIGIRPHVDGGPIADRSTRLLDATTPVPLPAAHPLATRTVADVEEALRARGWQVITRADAARRLLRSGYRLGHNRAAGHLLYIDDADASIWRRCRYCLEAFAVATRRHPDSGGHLQPLTHAAEGTKS
jgi:hypothetical protein